MAKYTITIRNNETGKVILDRDAGAIVGATVEGNDGVAIQLKGSDEETALAINLAEDAINGIFESED